MIPYEILIRGDKDGKLSGSHCIDTPGADARPITPEDLADIAPAINAAAIAETKELEAKHAEAIAAKDAEIATITAEKDSHYINDIEDKMQEIDELKALLTAAQAETQGVYQFRDNLLQMLASGADPLEVAKEALGTLEDKRRAAALAQIEELTAKAEALKAELGIE